MTTYGGDVIRCALSDAPIFADDEWLEDVNTGEAVLRCFVLPPRKLDDLVLPEMEAAE